MKMHLLRLLFFVNSTALALIIGLQPTAVCREVCLQQCMDLGWLLELSSTLLPQSFQYDRMQYAETFTTIIAAPGVEGPHLVCDTKGRLASYEFYGYTGIDGLQGKREVSWCHRVRFNSHLTGRHVASSRVIPFRSVLSTLRKGNFCVL